MLKLSIHNISLKKYTCKFTSTSSKGQCVKHRVAVCQCLQERKPICSSIIHVIGESHLEGSNWSSGFLWVVLLKSSSIFNMYRECIYLDKTRAYDLGFETLFILAIAMTYFHYMFVMPLPLGKRGITFCGSPSIRSPEYPLSTCTWVRWSIWPTVTIFFHPIPHLQAGYGVYFVSIFNTRWQADYIQRISFLFRKWFLYSAKHDIYQIFCLTIVIEKVF